MLSGEGTGSLAGRRLVRGGADPVPGELRRVLELEKRKGQPFSVAWGNACKCLRSATGWGRCDGRGRCQSDYEDAWEALTPLQFAQHFFARAYVGLPFTGDVSGIAQERPERTPHVRPVPIRVCGSGELTHGARCTEPPLPGRVLCARHAAQMDEIKARWGEGDFNCSGGLGDVLAA